MHSKCTFQYFNELHFWQLLSFVEKVINIKEAHKDIRNAKHT